MYQTRECVLKEFFRRDNHLYPVMVVSSTPPPHYYSWKQSPDTISIDGAALINCLPEAWKDFLRVYAKLDVLPAI